MHKEMSRSMQGLFRDMLVLPAQVVEGPHIKKITTWVDLCSARLPEGSKSINLAYWTVSSVGRTGRDQRDKDLNSRLMTCLPHWGPLCNSFPGVVLTVGCNEDIVLSDAGRCWSKLILAVADQQQNQMGLFPHVMLGFAHIWHLPLSMAAPC